MQVILQADQRQKQNHKKRYFAISSTRTIPIGERIWTGVEPGEYSLSDYAVSKKLIHLLRFARVPRDNDGAIEFWRMKDDLQKYFPHCPHWSDKKWKNSKEGGGQKKIFFSIVLTLQQFCTSELFKVIQDAVSLILHYKTMSLFRTVSSSTFITSDVQSIHIPSSIRD